MALESGIAAPDFTGTNTSTCTAQACNFRDAHSSLMDCNAIVVGVSPDSVASHVRFSSDYSLPYTLIADSDRAICELYDVWKEKQMYGRKYMGVERTTYLIDPDGTIDSVYSKVKVKGHIDQIVSSLVTAELKK